MPGLVDPPSAPAALPTPTGLGFSVSAQKVHFDVDFASRTLRGRTEISIQPHSKELRTIRLNCRQCVLTRLSVGAKSASLTYQDPYVRLQNLHPSLTVHQHHLLRKKVEAQLRNPPDEELVITLPKTVRIQELDPFSAAAQNAIFARPSAAAGEKNKEAGGGADGAGGGGGATSTTPGGLPVETPAPRTAEETGPVYTPIRIVIEFVIERPRDGIYFVGLREGDFRYPHVYTRNLMGSSGACCLFPCVDDPSARCLWEISIRCPNTLGDAFAASPKAKVNGTDGLTNGVKSGAHSDPTGGDHMILEGDLAMSDEEKALDLSVVCSGEMTDEIVDRADPTRKTVSFHCDTPVAAQHIGFAIGPFEHVDLSEFRDSDEDEKLGHNAIRMHGFCLPGRAAELRNTCMPLARAMDHFVVTYGSYPFSSYNLCFVDDLSTDVAHTASLSLCSNRLLYPEDIVDPMDKVTRTLVHGLASQWLGINIVAKEAMDMWVIVGCSYFMTDIFLEDLFGKNDYRYRQKLAIDRVFELDVQRPSIYQLGGILTLDQSEMELMALKAPLVLFILHQRLSAKAATKLGVNRIIWRLCLNAKIGELPNGAVSTPYFLRVSEKAAHGKLDTFFNQWVYGAGCPHFFVTQRFNKKKLIVEMLIKQVQADRPERQLEPETFMREAREEIHSVYAGPIQPLFTGSMTIRIHEADGTPYEHIVEINEVSKKVEIPYNTKYKRLKRSRRQKERAAAASGADAAADTQDDVLLYCLGDVLQSEEEMNEWRLTDWSKDDEDRMNQESYEWIRIDAEFEWIAKISFGMPHYMFVSQLQQDRDVVAQLDSIHYLASQKPHPLISSILVRTLMDRRYYHGIRTQAAQALARCATDELDWIGLFHLEKAFQEFFCFPNSSMTRSNDFSDRTAYLIQCAIPRSISKVRDNSGRAPVRAKRFLIEKLKFNDNSNNEYSDNFYIATLMSCLADALDASRGDNTYEFSLDEDEEEEADIRKNAMTTIERLGRIDEWIASYQNIYTTTSLDCFQTLIKKKVIPARMADFLPYSRPGNADVVRLKAFSCLIDLGMLRNDTMMKYLLYSFETEPSLYVRDQLFQIFGRGLGYIAIGRDKNESDAQQLLPGGLIVEHEASTGARAAEIARTQTAPGALIALRQEIGSNEVLKEAIRSALFSKVIGLKEFGDLLQLCTLLYNPVTSLMVTLRYPRYWKVEHLGQGKLKFTRASRVRTRPVPKFVWPPPTPISSQPTKTSTAGHPPALSRRQSSINLTSSQQSTQHASQPSHSPPQPPPNRTILKLKTKNLASLALSSRPNSGSSSVPPSASSKTQQSPDFKSPALQTSPVQSRSQPQNPAPSSGSAMSPPASAKIPRLKIRFGSFSSNGPPSSGGPNASGQDGKGVNGANGTPG